MREREMRVRERDERDAMNEISERCVRESDRWFSPLSSLLSLLSSLSFSSLFECNEGHCALLTHEVVGPSIISPFSLRLSLLSSFLESPHFGALLSQLTPLTLS